MLRSRQCTWDLCKMPAALAKQVRLAAYKNLQMKRRDKSKTAGEILCKFVRCSRFSPLQAISVSCLSYSVLHQPTQSLSDSARYCVCESKCEGEPCLAFGKLVRCSRCRRVRGCSTDILCGNPVLDAKHHSTD